MRITVVCALLAVAMLAASVHARPPALPSNFSCGSDSECVMYFGPNHWCNVNTTQECGYPNTPGCQCTDVRPPCAGRPIGPVYLSNQGLCEEACSAGNDDDADCDTSRCAMLLSYEPTNKPFGSCDDVKPSSWNCTDLAYLAQPCALKCNHCDGPQSYYYAYCGCV